MKCIHGEYDDCPKCAVDAEKGAPIPQGNDKKVLMFNGVTAHELPPDRVLGAAVGQLKNVLVIGYAEDDSFYFAGSDPSGPWNLWLLEVAKKKLIEITGE